MRKNKLYYVGFAGIMYAFSFALKMRVRRWFTISFEDYLSLYFSGCEVQDLHCLSSYLRFPPFWLFVVIAIIGVVLITEKNEMMQMNVSIIKYSGRIEYWICFCIRSFLNVLIIYGIILGVALLCSIHNGTLNIEQHNYSLYEGIDKEIREVYNPDNSLLILSIIHMFSVYILGIIFGSLSLFSKRYMAILFTFLIFFLYYFCKYNTFMLIRLDWMINRSNSYTVVCALGSVLLIAFFVGMFRAKRMNIMEEI